MRRLIQSRFKPGTHISFLIWATLASQMTPSVAQAMIPTTDWMHIGVQANEFIQQAVRHAGELQQWAAQIEQMQKQKNHWKTLAIMIPAMKLNVFSIKNEFKEIDEDFGVKASCGSSATGLGDITGSLSNLISDPSKDIRAQQLQLCQTIIRTKNRQYNDTVKYMESLKTTTKELEELQSKQINEVDNSPGNLQAIAADIERLTSQITQAREHWQSNIQQNEMQIRALEQMQGTYTRKALQGEKNDWGKAIRTISLQAALGV